MLAPNNALEVNFEITDVNIWNEWVFNKTIYLELNECELFWADRILHTTDAIIQQQKYTQNHPTYTLTEKEKELKKLKKRLSEIIDVLGYLPSSDHLFKDGSDNKEKLIEQGLYLKSTEKSRTKNNLTLLVKQLIEEDKLDNIEQLWNLLKQCENSYAKNLVYVHSIEGNATDAMMEWSAEEFGPVKQINRQSMGKIISKVRKELVSTKKNN